MNAAHDEYTALDRLVKRLSTSHVTGVEVTNVGLLFVWSLVLLFAPRHDETRLLYGVAPWPIWGMVAMTILCWKVIAIWIRSATMLRASTPVVAAWWGVIAVVVWRASHGPLLSSVFVAFAVMSFWRYGELARRNDA